MLNTPKIVRLKASKREIIEYINSDTPAAILSVHWLCFYVIKKDKLI